MGTRTWMRVVLTGAVVSLTAAALGGTSPAEGAAGPTVAQYACQGATGYAASVPVAVDYLAYGASRSSGTFTVGLTTPIGPVPPDAGTLEAWARPYPGYSGPSTYDPVAAGETPYTSGAPSGSDRTSFSGAKLPTNQNTGYDKAVRFTPTSNSVYCGFYTRSTSGFNSPSTSLDQIAGPTQP